MAPAEKWGGQDGKQGAQLHDGRRRISSETDGKWADWGSGENFPALQVALRREIRRRMKAAESCVGGSKVATFPRGSDRVRQHAPLRRLPRQLVFTRRFRGHQRFGAYGLPRIDGFPLLVE